VLQNEFTHVYSVMVPGLDVTLLHQHDLPYLYVTLGPRTSSTVLGQAGTAPSVQDGEVHYTRALAHIVRTDSAWRFAYYDRTGASAGTPKNLCKT